MENEISLGDSEESQKRNTGIRHEKKGSNYGFLRQDVYSVADLALIIGVHHTTILDQIKKGQLKALYLGGPAGYRITKKSVLNWMENIKEGDPS
jgi:excisionase family DNA binding protein